MNTPTGDYCERCGHKLQGVAGIDLPCADPMCGGILGDRYVVMSTPKDGISQKITLGRLIVDGAVRWHEVARQEVDFNRVDQDMRRDVMRHFFRGLET